MNQDVFIFLDFSSSYFLSFFNAFGVGEHIRKRNARARLTTFLMRGRAIILHNDFHMSQTKQYNNNLINRTNGWKTIFRSFSFDVHNELNKFLWLCFVCVHHAYVHTCAYNLKCLSLDLFDVFLFLRRFLLFRFFNRVHFSLCFARFFVSSFFIWHKRSER